MSEAAKIAAGWRLVRIDSRTEVSIPDCPGCGGKMDGAWCYPELTLEQFRSMI